MEREREPGNTPTLYRAEEEEEEEKDLEYSTAVVSNSTIARSFWWERGVYWSRKATAVCRTIPHIYLRYRWLWGSRGWRLQINANSIWIYYGARAGEERTQCKFYIRRHSAVVDSCTGLDGSSNYRVRLVIFIRWFIFSIKSVHSLLRSLFMSNYDKFYIGVLFLRRGVGVLFSSAKPIFKSSQYARFSLNMQLALLPLLPNKWTRDYNGEYKKANAAPQMFNWENS